MIHLFMAHPMWYVLPALLTMILMIIGARFFPNAYRGEARMLRDPALILPISLIWFLAIPLGVVAAVFWLSEKFFRILLPQHKDE